jgi:hypothetical protein
MLAQQKMKKLGYPEVWAWGYGNVFVREFVVMSCLVALGMVILEVSRVV